MKQGYIATIQVFVPSNEQDNGGNSSAYACDFIAEGLRDIPFLDWSYVRIGGQLLTPTAAFYDPATYQEGDAF